MLSAVTGQISCAVTAERKAGGMRGVGGVWGGYRGGRGEDDTGPRELITLNNGEQIKSNPQQKGEISR